MEPISLNAFIATSGASADGRQLRKSFEIRLDEIDFNGHLHDTKSMDYCAHTRYRHLVELGWDVRPMGEHGVGAATLAEEILYRREARLSALITVTYQVTGYSADGKRWRTRNQSCAPTVRSPRP